MTVLGSAGPSIVVPVVSIIVGAVLGLAGLAATVWQARERSKVEDKLAEQNREHQRDLADLEHRYEESRQRTARNAEWRKDAYVAMLQIVHERASDAANLDLDSPSVGVPDKALEEERNILLAQVDVVGTPAMRDLLNHWSAWVHRLYSVVNDIRLDHAAAIAEERAPDIDLRKRHQEAQRQLISGTTFLSDEAAREVQG